MFIEANNKIEFNSLKRVLNIEIKKASQHGDC